MSTVGNSSAGVILSSAIDATTGGPSGDIVYLTCDNIRREYKTMDVINHLAFEFSYVIPTGTNYYVVRITNALVVANTISEVNSYHEQIRDWAKLATNIYLWIKDSAGTYLRFYVTSEGAYKNYLKGVIRNPTEMIRHDQKTISLSIESIT